MKTCFKCKTEQALSEFYKHSQMADGHLNKCKKCAKIDAHKHRYGEFREKVLAYDLVRAKTPERKDAAKKIFEKWKAQNPERRAAHSKLRHAVKSRKVLMWPVCELPDCNAKPEAHHPDYGAPLSVVWLCPAHHKQAHALAGRLTGKFESTELSGASL